MCVDRGGYSYIDDRHFNRLELKAHLVSLDQDLVSMHKEMFKLFAGDWFMKAARRKEQVHLENAVSIP